ILGGFFLANLKRKHVDEASEQSTATPPHRMVSLDVFRGITIAAMTLVNEPGSWAAIYQPLAHAEWHGATPADWIFPFFLFIAGLSITFALGKYVGNGSARKTYLKIFRRAFFLFALGLVLEMFPFYNIWTATWFEPSTLRIM